MELDIATVVELQLYRTCDVNVSNMRLLLQAMKYIQRIISSSKRNIEELATNVDSFNVQFMCTWRPYFCRDMCIYVTDAPGDCIICFASDVDNCDINFYKTNDRLSIHDCSGIILCGHLTCDYDTENDCVRMVLLVYDCIMSSKYASDIRDSIVERYNWLLQHSHIIESFNIGSACVKLQWIGHSETHDKIKDIQLPHKKSSIIVISNEHEYTQYNIECA